MMSRYTYEGQIIKPLPTHPEARTGEIYTEYTTPENFENQIMWKTKRLGKVAYTRDGRIVPGKFPVFVQSEEYYAAHSMHFVDASKLPHLLKEDIV